MLDEKLSNINNAVLVLLLVVYMYIVDLRPCVACNNFVLVFF